MNTLPMHDVSAMGRKLDGWFGSASAFFFPSRRMTPTFQAWGTHLDDQHLLKRCNSSGIRDGHFFRTMYGIWSSGLGVDDVFDRAMTFSTSSSVNSQVTKGMVGDGATGIHDGEVKEFGADA